MVSANAFIKSSQGEKSMFEERIMTAKAEGDQVVLSTESGERRAINGFIEEIDFAELNLIICEGD